MSSDLPKKAAIVSLNDLRVVTREALSQLLEPLVGLVLDSGLSIRELNSILREAAVRTVAARQLEVERRVNISGIAASTGIPRAVISRILKSKSDLSRSTTDRQRQSTNRILSVWHQDPRFNTPAGKPADLKIYGRGSTFEALVRSHGRGIPIRAILDELTRAGAAEIVSPQLVRAKTSVAIDRGLTPRVIRSFGERATELLSTMLHNMKNPENPRFVASVLGANISSKVIPSFRRELASKGADFLADMHDSLHRESIAKRRVAPASRVSVTIYYHETPRKLAQKKEATKRRRNLRRDI